MPGRQAQIMDVIFLDGRVELVTPSTVKNMKHASEHSVTKFKAIRRLDNYMIRNWKDKENVILSACLAHAMRRDFEDRCSQVRTPNKK